MSEELKKPIEGEGAGAGGEGTDDDVKTLDDILKDKIYQSEFDKKVAKALATAKEKWEAEAEVEAKKKRTEAEKLAKMDAEAKAKYEREKVERERDAALSKLNAYELKEVASEIAAEKGVPLSLLKLIDYTKENAESIKGKIEELELAYKQAVESGINEKLKEKPPKTVLGAETKTIKSRESY